jgi:uncharacterized protein (DUF58 family)
MNTVRINPYPVLLAAFFLAILYLAGMSFGGVLYFLFLVLLIFVIVSWVHLFVSYRGFRFYQEFSNDHPVKGETVIYRLCLENESSIPNPCVRVMFKQLGTIATSEMKPFSMYLKKKQRYIKEYAILCPYRGVYTVGLESIVVSDFLEWIACNPEVWYRTFYVYPRVIVLRSFFLDRHSHIFSGGPSKGTQADHMLFRGLDRYREGMSLKNMYWKKFIATGEPYIKLHESTSWPGLDIYLDLGRDEDTTEKVLEREDCSVEIAIAVAKYLLDRNVQTALHAIGTKRYDFFGIDGSSFAELHKATIGFFFDKSHSIAHAYNADMQGNGTRQRTALFITHFPDPELFELAARIRGSSAVAHIVLNQTGMSDEEKEKCDRYVLAATEKGASVRVVRNPSTIRSDLEERP